MSALAIVGSIIGYIVVMAAVGTGIALSQGRDSVFDADHPGYALAGLFWPVALPACLTAAAARAIKQRMDRPRLPKATARTGSGPGERR